MLKCWYCFLGLTKCNVPVAADGEKRKENVQVDYTWKGHNKCPRVYSSWSVWLYWRGLVEHQDLRELFLLYQLVEICTASFQLLPEVYTMIWVNARLWLAAGRPLRSDNGQAQRHSGQIARWQFWINALAQTLYGDHGNIDPKQNKVFFGVSWPLEFVNTQAVRRALAFWNNSFLCHVTLSRHLSFLPWSTVRLQQTHCGFTLLMACGWERLNSPLSCSSSKTYDFTCKETL